MRVLAELSKSSLFPSCDEETADLTPKCNDFTGEHEITLIAAFSKRNGIRLVTFPVKFSSSWLFPFFEARELIAPYSKLQRLHVATVIAIWYRVLFILVVSQ